MGFLERLFKGNVFKDKRNPNMVCEMVLCGQKYILTEFDLKFSIKNGKESLEAYAVFSESLNSMTENWITASSRRENGLVKFYRNSDTIREGALFDAKFFDASCIQYRKSIHNGIPTTTILMTMTSIKLIGEDFSIK